MKLFYDKTSYTIIVATHIGGFKTIKDEYYEFNGVYYFGDVCY